MKKVGRPRKGVREIRTTVPQDTIDGLTKVAEEMGVKETEAHRVILRKGLDAHENGRN